MQYIKHYNKLIDRARTRPIPNEYTERHHIIPQSMNGSDDADNIVHLTAREHFLAHLLLWKNGAAQQILSVQCFWSDPDAAQLEWLDNSHQNHPRKLAGIRAKRWLRREAAYQYARNIRAKNKSGTATT